VTCAPLGAYSIGDDFGQHENAADFTVALLPGLHHPAKNILRAIAAWEWILFAGFRGACHASLVYRLPVFADFRKDLVMAQALEVPVAESIVDQPASAVSDVAHLRVEHRNGGRRLFDHRL
jgi:hypothetical protein